MARKLSSQANYVSKRNIKSITVQRGKKTTEIKNKDILDGAYVKKGVKYAKGGALSKYKYVPNRNIESVELSKGNKTIDVDGADVLDGLYVRKGKYAKGGSMYRTGGVAGSKRVDVAKGYRLEHGYKAIRGEDKNKDYSKGKPKVKVDRGYRLPSGYEVREGAYNKKYEDGGMMAKGGSLSSKEAKAMKQLEKHIKYNFVNTDMGSGWKFYLDNFDLEMRYLDIFDAEGIEDYDSLSKEDKKYYYDEWKEDLWQSSYEKFKKLAFEKYGYYYMEDGGNTSGYCYNIGGL